MKKNVLQTLFAVSAVLLGIFSARAQEATTLAKWDFTNENYGNYTNGNSNPIAAHVGTGSLSFGSTGNFTVEGSSTSYGSIKFNAPVCGELTPEQAIDPAKHTSYIQADFSTLGYLNPVVSLGFAANENTTFYLVTSVDGGSTWNYVGEYTKTASGWSTLENFQDIAISAARSENAQLRFLVGVHGNGQNSGDIYFDNLSIVGTAYTPNNQVRTVFESDFSDWVSPNTVPTVLTTIPAYSGEIQLQQTPAGCCSVALTANNGNFDTKGNNACVLPYKEYYLQLNKDNGDVKPELKIGPIKNLRKFVFVEANTGNNRGSIVFIQGKDEENETAVLTQSIHLYEGGADGVRHTLDLVNNQTECTDGGSNTSTAPFTFTDAQREEAYIIIRNYRKPGDIASDKDSYFFYMAIDAEVEITAEQVNLTTAVEPAEAGKISVTPNTTQFDKDSYVKLSQDANFGYRFSHWENGNGENLGTDAELNYQMTADVTIKAVFETVNTYSLTMEAVNGKNYMLTVSPEGEMINGQRMYEEGTEIQVSAISGEIFSFTSWEDGTTNATRTLTMNANTTVTANFSNVPYIVGWDFYQSGRENRPADMANETSNQGMLVLRKEDGTTSSWLDKSSAAGGYEGRNAAVNWRPFGTSDNYYYEINFGTTAYHNIRVQSSMLLNYNAFSVQKVQYSVDGTSYVDLGTITLPGAKTWVTETFTLPEEAEGKEKIYIRWIPDYTSEVKGTTSANDGTAISGIYVFADQEMVEDHDAPVVLTTVPENNATSVTAKGSIILNFNEQVVAGEGDCTLNGEVLDVKFAGTSVIFSYSGLAYNTSYTFTVPAGAIEDRSGNAFAGTTLSFTTMDRTQPAAALYDAVVAQDGTGDYTSLKAAIEAAPANRVAPWLIFIKEGTYREHIDIPVNKPFIHLIGQDKMLVTITDSLLCGGDNALHVSQGATVVVNATDFYAENITFDNKHGVDLVAGPQALAMYTDNDRATFYNCRLRSYQDTYLTSTNHVSDRHYLKDCWIEGAVDFIYGGGDVYFDACTLNIVRQEGGYIVAPSHHETTEWGYVFANNTITAPTSPASATQVYLGRPWQGAPKTVFLNTRSEVTIYPAGWYYKMGAIPAVFADYKTTDGNGNLVDLSNRIEDYEYDVKNAEEIVIETVKGKAKKSLTDEEAAEYTYKNVLSGTDGWNPRELMEAVGKPANVELSAGQLTWDAVDYARCYVVFKGNDVIGFTTSTSYSVDDVTATYYIKAANEYGSLSEFSEPASSTGTGTNLVENTAGDFTVHAEGDVLILDQMEAGQNVQIFSVDGRLLYSCVASQTQMNIQVTALPAVYLIRVDGQVKKFLKD